MSENLENLYPSRKFICQIKNRSSVNSHQCMWMLANCGTQLHEKAIQSMSTPTVSVSPTGLASAFNCLCDSTRAAPERIAWFSASSMESLADLSSTAKPAQRTSPPNLIKAVAALFNLGAFRGGFCGIFNPQRWSGTGLERPNFFSKFSRFWYNTPRFMVAFVVWWSSSEEKLLATNVASAPGVATILDSLTTFGSSFEKYASSGAVAFSFLHCLIAFKDSGRVMDVLPRKNIFSTCFCNSGYLS